MDRDIRYIIVEDQEIVSFALKMALEGYPRLSLLGLANDGVAGVEMALALKPDIVILDLGLPKLDGIEATRQICAAAPNIKVLINSSRTGPRDVFSSFAAGALGCISKECSAAEMYHAMQAVMNGPLSIDRKIARSILTFCQELQWSTTLTAVDGSPLQFSEKELGVMALMAQGLTDHAMAEKLGLDLQDLSNEKHSLRVNLASLGSRLRG